MSIDLHEHGMDFRNALVCTPGGELAPDESDKGGRDDVKRCLQKFQKDNPELRRLPYGAMNASRYFADRSANGGIWYTGASDQSTAPGMELTGTYSSPDELVLADFHQNKPQVYQEFSFTKWFSLSEDERQRHVGLYYRSRQVGGYAKLPPRARDYLRNHTFHEPLVPAWAEAEEAFPQRSAAFTAFYARLRARFIDTYRGGFTHEVLGALEGTDRGRAMALAHASVMDGDYECVTALIRLVKEERVLLALLEHLMCELADGAECKLYVAYNLLLITRDRTFDAYLRWHGVNGEMPEAAINYLVRTRVEKATLELLLERVIATNDSMIQQPSFRYALSQCCGVKEHGRFTPREIGEMLIDPDATIRQGAADEIWRIWREHPDFFDRG